MAAKHDTPQHRGTRKAWAPIVEAGHAYCAETICLMPDRWIPPGTPWDLAHNRNDHGYLGPAHRKCNRSEGATRGNRARVPHLRRWVL